MNIRRFCVWISLLVIGMTLSMSTACASDQLYFLEDYDAIEDENSVFVSLTWEELVMLLERDGESLILFGGPWCPNTTPVIGFINDVAKEYGVNTIYTFDFRLDGATADAHVRESDGATKNGRTVSGSHYNYLYGELVSRYLTNLDDYVEYKADSPNALSYTDAAGRTVTVAELQVPLLILYSKDNLSDDGTPAPIRAGLEMMMTAEDFEYLDGSPDEERIEDYKQILRTTVFEATDINRLTDFSDADYIRSVYNQKSGRELFAEDAQINIDVVNYRQFQWLLNRGEEALFLLGGASDEETRAQIVSVNDYAVANDLTVYQFDPWLDGDYPRTAWGYTRELDIRDVNNEFFRLYSDLMEDYLYGATEGETVTFQTADGETGSVLRLAVPYFFTYSRNQLDENGHKLSIVEPINLTAGQPSASNTDEVADEGASAARLPAEDESEDAVADEGNVSDYVPLRTRVVALVIALIVIAVSIAAARRKQKQLNSQVIAHDEQDPSC